MQRIDDAALPEDFSKAKQFLTVEENIKILEIDENTIASYVLLTYLRNMPILMLGIDKDRLIMNQGRKSLFYFIIAIISTGLLLADSRSDLSGNTVISRPRESNWLLFPWPVR